MTNHDILDDTGLVLGDDGRLRPPWAARDPLLRDYFDTEWGVPVHDEAGVFERIALEGFQAGLSWVTVLRKRPAFREAFAGFDPDAVAVFDDGDIERLLEHPGIIRNRQKIAATIGNARATIALRDEGGLSEFVWSYRPDDWTPPSSIAEVPTTTPESVELSKELRRRGFRFVGPTTMFALMEAIGMVDTRPPGAYRPTSRLRT
ncbi:DNA-3-methyladenine glycosylase I [Gulosibacter faecalis]|uniref:DNA-3-methyladenine glycosylase I n=1 Tax=Gulosibacter faecalis TaxID=272240 RepID=A0ABW5UXR4_9MICO